MSLLLITRAKRLFVLTICLLATSVYAQESVNLTPKFEPGASGYVEGNETAKTTSKSPMGDFTMTLEIQRGLRVDVSTHGDGVRVASTLDRLGFVFDSAIGRTFYDSDIPDEEQSEQWEQILGPQIGMTLNIDLDADHKVVASTGMDEIVQKVDSGVTSGNMFWEYEKPKYTNERHQAHWENMVLSIFPNRDIKVGESWTAPYLEPLAELKDFSFECTYTLDKVVEKNGRTFAVISFTGKPADPDRKYEADSMMPVSNIKLESATLTGTAAIYVEHGELFRREDHAEISYSATAGAGENGPPTSSHSEITRTYALKTLEDRDAEKKANAELAAAKAREAEAAKAERRRRFAETEQTDVNTAIRPNPSGVASCWPQWGGAHGDFKADTTGLADKWPDGGPKTLWRRDLGDGYSSIIDDGDRLYTMYRPTDPEKNKSEEHIVALDAKTGETVWDISYDAPYDEGMDAQFGHGPHSTPVIVGDRLFAVGSMVNLHCVDKNTGKVIWERNLHKDYEASTMQYGYGASPLAYKDLIILPVGGKGQAVVAFKQSDGSEAWKNQDFGPTHASVGVAKAGDKEELILFSSAEVAGLNPENGDLYWRVEQPTQWGANISTPVLGDDGILFISSAYGMGSRGVQLSVEDGKPAANELWYNNKMRVHHGNAVRVGGFVYGASGDFGPVFYAAVDVKTGELAWRSRDIGKSTTIAADGKLIILNEDGKLFLAKASPAELDILSSAELGDGRTWTAPTLVGKTLFVRDRKQIMALDLG
ncbi:MAG: PQQ-like beta-propeller repeat protein [Phycisphaerales bacterium]|nr:PQQ-like beta-propeller repeat protein [Phycisphaerales bacterium]